MKRRSLQHGFSMVLMTLALFVGLMTLQGCTGCQSQNPSADVPDTQDTQDTTDGYSDGGDSSDGGSDAALDGGSDGDVPPPIDVDPPNACLPAGVALRAGPAAALLSPRCAPGAQRSVAQRSKQPRAAPARAPSHTPKPGSPGVEETLSVAPSGPAPLATWKRSCAKRGHGSLPIAAATRFRPQTPELA